MRVRLLMLLGLLAAQGSRADEVYVVRRGWHIDLGFAVSELAGPLVSITGDLPGARYVLFGFGDRRYMMAKHSHVPAMSGALWPGQGLILSTGLTATPAGAVGAGSVVELQLTPAQSHELQAFIMSSLHPRAPTGTGAVEAFTTAGRGPYQGSVYLDSDLRYSGLHTCNTWAAEALRNAHLPIRSTGTIFASQLWRQVKKLSGTSAGAGTWAGDGG